MKKLLVNLSILSVLALVALPMVSCAPNEEAEVNAENNLYEDDAMENMGEAMEEEGDELEEMGDELDDPMMEEEGEMMEEMGEEMEEEEEPPAI